MTPSVVLAVATAAFVLACGEPRPPEHGRAQPEVGVDAAGRSAPTPATAEANAAVARALALDDPQDFADARRGLVASEPEVVVRDATGRIVWDTAAYGFVHGDAPASVNPSLWRQAKLNGIHGLFEVVPGIYQVRGYDIANLTIIDGHTGWIVVDPLTTRETAAAAFAFARRHLGERPVVAVIFTHSHVDHFGGVDAVLPADPAARRAVRIVAPRGFLEEATSENVLAGIAMGRRAAFMYGLPLERGPRGHVDSGLGKQPPRGTLGIAVPTELVDRTPQAMEIDGVAFVFQYAPDSEAPAELAFYLPERRAFCGAELVTHTLHNLYTLRGAKIRDALRWSGYIDEALERFGDAEVVFTSHHWPVWGNARVAEFLARQRDAYRYIHDQTLRLANAGLGPAEIAEELRLPASLQKTFAVRDYYGTVRHNAKGVYQAYFGWYDGNPAHLDPLPPEAASRRYVEAMGGRDAVLARAREACARGEERWAVTLLNHLVFAAPDDREARALLAETYEQLGYRAESGPWRDAYLTAAHELRHGATGEPIDRAAAAALLRELPMDRFFLAMATRLDGPRADGRDTIVNFVLSDLGESWVLELQHAVLHARRREPDPRAVATMRLTKEVLVRLATGQAGLRELLFSDAVAVEGSRLALLGFLQLFDRGADGRFPIVTP